ncbi:thiol reductant ABC exporter subunit CydD [Moraxella sp. VT-16-12]|uniref:thiol reductant ABC exporter subunit CydD n=1 Tax=Moraxella sp. VT-16-12 TaxID=2014877 RepID=UPI000B7E1EC2|nr:thiol reductant ABC exporter subunit CydD [Moraxella sp. VT-16-12]TWV84905.1 thiol reductant ABC exporter subunit CydD [Moraxella sp. VT-16-12]
MSHSQHSPKNNKNKRKKPRRSQEDIMANAFLRATFKPVKKSMIMAWFLDVVSVLLLVGQTSVLVAIFSFWLDYFLGKSELVAPNIWWWAVVVGLLMVARAVLAYVRDYLLTNAGLSVAKSVRQRLFDKLGELGLARRYFGADGALATKIVSEPDHLIGFARFDVQKMTAVTTPIILAGCISFYSVTASVILLLTAPLVPIFMAFIGIATARKSREQMDALAQLGGRFLDWIRGINTLSRLSAVDIAVVDIEKSSEDYRKRTMSVLKIAFLNSAVLEFLSALSIALVAVYLGFGLMGILPWAEGQVLTTYSTALFILLLVPEFYAPLRRLGAEYHVKGQAMACAKAIAPMLNFKSKHTQGVPITLKTPPSFHLKNITAFGDDGRVRLSPTTLDFMAGKRSALMGESGAGKSTILHILLGFGDYEGDVLIDDGVSYRYGDIDVAHLRQQMGYLSQSVPLLPLSIGENLRLAKASASDDELWAVLDDVGLSAVIRALPMGLDTPLGERGRGLSGGQGQRLGIAQLLLQDSNVWLLDEPTEHLDVQTADEIKSLLWRLSAGKTVIWVTHDENFGDLTFDVVHDLNKKGQADEK